MKKDRKDVYGRDHLCAGGQLGVAEAQSPGAVQREVHTGRLELYLCCGCHQLQSRRLLAPSAHAVQQHAGRGRSCSQVRTHYMHVLRQRTLAKPAAWKNGFVAQQAGLPDAVHACICAIGGHAQLQDAFLSACLSWHDHGAAAVAMHTHVQSCCSGPAQAACCSVFQHTLGHDQQG